MSSKRKMSSQIFLAKAHHTRQEEEKSGTHVPSGRNTVVRKMQTNRPFTPCDRNRLLLSSSNILSRPTSSTISRSNSFEYSERRASTSFKLQPISNQKVRDDQHIEEARTKSTVTKTPPINVPPRKNSGESRSHSSPSSLPPIIVCGKSILSKAPETKPKGKLNLPEKASSKEKSEKIYHNSKAVKSYTGENSGNGNLIRSSSQDNEAFISLESCQLSPNNNNSNNNNHELTETKKFSVKMSEILSHLEKFCISGMEGEVNRVIEAVNELHKVLEDSNMYGIPFEHRFSVLRLLFKLLDSNNASLTLNVAKVVFAVKVSGKNLMHLCKVIYKISTDKKNDADFQKCNILGPFLNGLRNIGISSDPDTLLYSIATVKFLSINKSLITELYNCDCPQIFLHHLSEMNEILKKDKKSCLKILIQLIIALRNMTENEVVLQDFISNGTLQQVFCALKICIEDADVVLPAIRFMSKVADDKKGCETIKTFPDVFSVFMELFKIHNAHLNIIVRLGYIVGNLISDDSSVALGFYNEPDFLTLLLSTVNDYVHLDLKKKEMGLKTIVYKDKLFDFDEKQWKEDVPDVIVKMIRILANMCLHSEIGSSIAVDKSCVVHIVQMIDAYKNQDMSVEETWVPFLSILIAVNNMTYFMHNHFHMSPSMINLTQCILPFMSDVHDVQLRLEACSIIGNLTRSPEVRLYILENNCFPLLISLLDENDKEILYLAYGVIMNILIDQSSGNAFYKEGGVTKLLHRLHLCLSRDWEMVALLCQILWNYCGGNETFFIPLSTIEIQHLIKVLTYAIRNGADIEKDGEIIHQAWNNMFCPVAQKLLLVLKSKSCQS